MNNITARLTAAAAVLGAVVLGLAGVSSAVGTGDTVTTALQGWSDQAVAMIPAALAAGLALFGVTILIRFGKRVFTASK